MPDCQIKHLVQELAAIALRGVLAVGWQNQNLDILELLAGSSRVALMNSLLAIHFLIRRFESLGQ